MRAAHPLALQPSGFPRPANPGPFFLTPILALNHPLRAVSKPNLHANPRLRARPRLRLSVKHEGLAGSGRDPERLSPGNRGYSVARSRCRPAAEAKASRRQFAHETRATFATSMQLCAQSILQCITLKPWG